MLVHFVFLSFVLKQKPKRKFIFADKTKTIKQNIFIKMNYKNIFITGVTGFLGNELVKGLLNDYSDGNIYLLIRSNKRLTAQERFNNYLNELSNDLSLDKAVLKERLQLVEGDVESPKLGLSDSDFQNLAQKIDGIYHSAASVHLTAPIEIIRKTNVTGTLHVLQLGEMAMQKGGLKAFHHVSTAYIAGKRKGIIYEKDLDCVQKFNNNYEQCKFEAEKLVETYHSKIPITVFRPSIIMGHSKTGWTNAFNVLYEPMRMGYFNSLPVIPISPKATIDIVPIDFVSESLLYLSHLDEGISGKTFHLSIGQGRAVPAIEFVDKVIEYITQIIEKEGLTDVKLSNPLKLPPWLFQALSRMAVPISWGKPKKYMKKMLTYSDYVVNYKQFNNDECLRLLEGSGIVAPKVQDYLETICKFCVKMNFGRAVKRSK